MHHRNTAATPGHTDALLPMSTTFPADPTTNNWDDLNREDAVVVLVVQGVCRDREHGRVPFADVAGRAVGTVDGRLQPALAELVEEKPELLRGDDFPDLGRQLARVVVVLAVPREDGRWIGALGAHADRVGFALLAEPPGERCRSLGGL